MKTSTLILALSSPILHAQWTLIDDMENGNNWEGPGTTGGASTIVTDPSDPNNLVFSCLNSGIRIENYYTLPTSIAEGSTATLFFRFRSSDNSGLADWVVGASDVAIPADWPDFEGYIRLADGGTANDIDIDARNGGLFTEVGGADTDIWINVWLVFDTTADTTDVYFNTVPVSATSAGTLSLTGAGFRNGTTSDLLTILAINNRSGSTGFLDDIYLDPSGENLTHPFATDGDGDGMNDLWEESFFGDTSRDGSADFDGDNLTDLQEHDTGTNPILKDTDGDTIDDDIELAGSANPFDNAPTNPLLADSDNDGFDDATEGAASSNPNDPLSFPAQPSGFQLIEDFEGAGMITDGSSFNGVNGWTASVPTALSVITEENSTDQVARLERLADMTTINVISKNLNDLGLQILEGSTGTLFFQVKSSSLNPDQSIGLSDVNAPTAFGDFEAQSVIFRNNILRARDAALFRDPATYAQDTWMNVWIVADNAADQLKIYVESPDGQTGQVEITNDGGLDPFNFRNGTTDHLSSIFLITALGAEAGSTVLIDNIYLDPTSANLTRPAPSKANPATGLSITSSSFNQNGDLIITFTPGGEGYILTGSNDLNTPFEEEVDAFYDGTNTFTIDADDVISTRRFYRIEKP